MSLISISLLGVLISFNIFSFAHSYDNSVRNFKRGVSYSIPHGCDVLDNHVASSWWYSWSPKSGFSRGFCDDPDDAYEHATNDLDFEFVPMFGHEVPPRPFEAEIERNLKAAKYLMTYNEPEQEAQSDVSAEEAATSWPVIEDIAKEYGLILVSPCGTSIKGLEWTKEWIEHCDRMYTNGCHFDHVCLHTYLVPEPCTEAEWSCFGEEGANAIEKINNWHDAFNKPIWLTEFACSPNMDSCDGDKNMDLMNQYMYILENDDRVFRYAWYGKSPSNLTEKPWQREAEKTCHNIKTLLPSASGIGQCYRNAYSDSDCHKEPLTVLASGDNCYCAEDTCDLILGAHWHNLWRKDASLDSAKLTPLGERYQNEFEAPTPTPSLSQAPSVSPSIYPTHLPSDRPSDKPTNKPSESPTKFPTKHPSKNPTNSPTVSNRPTLKPTIGPSKIPSKPPTNRPTVKPTIKASKIPSKPPNPSPTKVPTGTPSKAISKPPTAKPSNKPSGEASSHPTKLSTANPSHTPTNWPTPTPVQCSIFESHFKVIIKTDSHGDELKYSLKRKNAAGDVVGDSILFGKKLPSNTRVIVEECISPYACYRFKIIDKGKNGICCSSESGNGMYQLLVNGEVKKTSQFSTKKEITNIGDCYNPNPPTPPTPLVSPTRIPIASPVTSPSTTMTAAPIEPMCSPNKTHFKITINTDQNGQDIKYSLVRRNNKGEWSKNKFLSGKNLPSNAIVEDEKCILSRKCFMFKIVDKAGDGLCCSIGNRQGKYTILLNGTVKKTSQFINKSVEKTLIGKTCWD